MSLNSKKICFSLVLAAAAGMVQAANGSCLLADAGLWPCRTIRHLPETIPLTVLKRNNAFSVPLPWRKRLSVYRNF